MKNEDKETVLSIETNLTNWFNSKNKNMFEKMLDEASDSFRYWRYIYEKDAGHINRNFY